MNNQSLLSIKKFTSYKAYLNHYVELKKQQTPTFSLGSWAKHMGLKDTSSIGKVINGQREAGPQIADKLINYFSFSPSEEKYFRNLIKLSKLKNNPELSTALLEKMGKLQETKY